MRVLAVEDDEGIAQGLRSRLQQHGCVVDLAGGLEAAWAALCAEAFDLVLLDLGLPDGDGLTLLRRLRGRGAGLPDARTPVLVMTARDEVSGRIAALDMGADDYLTKPFDSDELAARMRAVRRRAAGRAEPQLVIGEVRLEPASRSVWRTGQPVELSGREWSLLLALAEVRPRVLSRQQLEERLYVWDGGPGSNTIEVHVHHLRRKLGEGLIRTLRGVGYFIPAEA